MAKLTDGKGGTIAKAQPPEKGQRFIFDDHRDAPRGFGLRITAAGGKAFILKYNVDGRQRRKTIGAWPTWSLVAARDKARELVQQIDGGTDPLDEERRRRVESTVEAAVEDWLNRYVDGLTSAKAIEGYFRRDVIPVIGPRKLTDVTRRDLIDIIEDKAKSTPVAARHLLAYLKSFFTWCMDREMVDLSPADAIRPKSITVKGKKNVLKPKKRKRVLSDDEIRAFWQSDCFHPLTGLALKLILVTGQRPGEIAGMHQSEIDGELWTIPAERRGKTESEHVIGLTPMALELIDQAQAEVERLSKRRKASPAGFVFESRAGKPLAVDALSKAVARHRETVSNDADPKFGHWTPHDLRRTCRTGMAICGVADEIGERVIGHVSDAMVETYNQAGYIDEKRDALATWNRHLQKILGMPTPDNVVELERRA